MENENIVTGNETTVETSTEQETKTYTQDEVLALIQSESDKRVTQALKTERKKYERQLSLSKLDGDEREKAEKDAKIAELQEQLAKFEIERNKSELKSVLSSRGLSAEFADIIAITDDIEGISVLGCPDGSNADSPSGCPYEDHNSTINSNLQPQKRYRAVPKGVTTIDQLNTHCQPALPADKQEFTVF